MYLLSIFKKQIPRKEKTTKQLRNAALVSGALTVPGLVDAGIDAHKGLNIEKNINNKLAKNKAALIATHPDKFVGKGNDVIDNARKKFQQLSNEKDNLKQLKNSTDELKGLKGLTKLRRSIGINIENKAKSALEELSKQQTEQLGRKVIATPEQLSQVTKGSKVLKKIGYGLTALGTVSAGVKTAKYINRKRKEREDKGKKRGNYK